MEPTLSKPPDGSALAIGPGLFQCGSCKRSYKRLDHLARHVRTRQFHQSPQNLYLEGSSLSIVIGQTLKQSRIDVKSAPRLSPECESSPLLLTCGLSGHEAHHSITQLEIFSSDILQAMMLRGPKKVAQEARMLANRPVECHKLVTPVLSIIYDALTKNPAIDVSKRA
jgi:hypothetical protein